MPRCSASQSVVTSRSGWAYSANLARTVELDGHGDTSWDRPVGRVRSGERARLVTCPAIESTRRATVRSRHRNRHPVQYGNPSSMTAARRACPSIRLVERNPTISGAEIASELVPPPQFEHATFESYRPDPDFPSQQAALDRAQGVRRRLARRAAPGRVLLAQARRRDRAAGRLPRRRLRRRQDPPARRALARRRRAASTSARSSSTRRWSARSATRRRSSCSAARRLLCIDEFELDDPGDTMLMTRLLGELIAARHPRRRDVEHPAERARRGPVRRAGLPARDPRAVRELRDAPHRRPRLPPSRHRGPRRGGRRRDAVRHREALAEPRPPGRRSTSFDDAHRAPRHRAPVEATSSSSRASTLIALARRARADRTRTTRCASSPSSTGSTTPQVPIIASGAPLDQVFADDMMAGGYRKKYLRAMSRHDRAHDGRTAAARLSDPRASARRAIHSGCPALAETRCLRERRLVTNPKHETARSKLSRHDD